MDSLLPERYRNDHQIDDEPERDVTTPARADGGFYITVGSDTSRALKTAMTPR